MGTELKLVFSGDDVETSADDLGEIEQPDKEGSILGIGSIVDERYELERLLGEGGYGVVYQARQLSTGQYVALKILRLDKIKAKDGSVNEVARFEREMQLIGRLNHPNIVKLIDFGTMDNGQLYTVIEYIDGIDLATLLEQEGAMRPSEAKYLMTQVLEALGATHALGIVYRDLKPQNIMITTHGVRRGVKLLDFGISGLIEDVRDKDYKNLTQDGKINGTPSYMAPEQLRALPPTPQTDIYAWGLVFLEMLLGHQVISDESYVEVLAKQISSEPIEIPEELVEQPLGEILARALEKPLDRRYQDVHEVLVDLEDCIVPQTMVLPWTGQIARSRIQQSISVRQSRGRTPSGSISSVWSDSMRLDALPEEELKEEPSSKKPLVLIGIVLLLLCAVVGVVVSQSDNTSEVTKTPEISTTQETKAPPTLAVNDPVPPTTETPVEVTPPVEPKAVELKLTLNPSQAALYLDDKPVTTEQLAAAQLNDGNAHVLEVKAKGYESFRQTFKALGELPAQIELQRERSSGKSWRRTSTGSSRSSGSGSSKEPDKVEEPTTDKSAVPPKDGVKKGAWDVKKNDLENPWK